MIVETLVRFQRINPESGIFFPAKATPGSAGFDLYTQDDVLILPAQTAKVPSGVKIEIPEGYFGMIVPRSSAYLSGLDANGTIDSDYRGEVFMLLRNISNKAISITRHSRIVQLLIVPHLVATLYSVPIGEKLSLTERGTKGFGSSGI